MTRPQLYLLESHLPGQRSRYYITASESGTGKPEWTEAKGDASRLSKIQCYTLTHELPHNRKAIMTPVPTRY